jgi:hypothetical protein
MTEAIATAGGIITTFGQYRFTLTQRYLSFSLNDLSPLSLLLYLVNFRLATLENILLVLCMLIIITAYGLMNAIFPPDSSFGSVLDSASKSDANNTNVAMVLRLIEPVRCVILAYLVYPAIRRLKIALASENEVLLVLSLVFNLTDNSFYIEPQTRIHLDPLSLRLQDYCIPCLLCSLLHLFTALDESSTDILYLINFIVYAVMIMHWIVVVLPESKSKPGKETACSGTGIRVGDGGSLKKLTYWYRNLEHWDLESVKLRRLSGLGLVVIRPHRGEPRL